MERSPERREESWKVVVREIRKIRKEFKEMMKEIKELREDKKRLNKQRENEGLAEEEGKYCPPPP